MSKYASKSNDSTNDTGTNDNDGPTITSTYIGRSDEEIEEDKLNELMKKIITISKEIRKKEEKRKEEKEQKKLKKKSK